jgi:hypothetical protein
MHLPISTNRNAISVCHLEHESFGNIYYINEISPARRGERIAGHDPHRRRASAMFIGRLAVTGALRVATGTSAAPVASCARNRYGCSPLRLEIGQLSIDFS